MIKIGIYFLTIFITVTLPSLMANGKMPDLNETKIIIHQKGKQKNINRQSPFFQELMKECTELFLTADSGYRLILNETIIENVKNNSAIELIYSEVQNADIPKTIYYTRLLIPVKGKFSNGTVFFAGISEYELARGEQELTELNYRYVDVYRVSNFVLNTKGIGSITDTLNKMME